MSKKHNSTSNATHEIDLTPEFVVTVLREIVEREFDGSVIESDDVDQHIACGGLALVASQAARKALRRGVNWQCALQVLVDASERVALSHLSDIELIERVQIKGLVLAAFSGSDGLHHVSATETLLDKIPHMATSGYVESKILSEVATAAYTCLIASRSLERGECDQKWRDHSIEMAVEIATRETIKLVASHAEDITVANEVIAVLRAIPAKPAESGRAAARRAKATKPAKRTRKAA